MTHPPLKTTVTISAMDRPVVPRQCAHINCETGDVIYPSDEAFYFRAGFYFCCAQCLDRAASHRDSLCRLAVLEKKKRVAQQRAALGL